jgi:hypothetical protein
MSFAVVIHYAAEYQYYATVLCKNIDKPEMKCNGQCKLAQELKATESSETPMPPAAPEIMLVSWIFIPDSAVKNFVRAANVRMGYPGYRDSAISSDFQSESFQPPEALI